MFHVYQRSFILSILYLGVFSNPIDSRQNSLSGCLASKNVPTSLIASSDWSSLISPYNLRLAYTPAAVTLPTTVQQIADSVLCAAGAGVKVQAKSGGHSYASFSSGGQDGSLIVDMQEFNSIYVNSSTFVEQLSLNGQLLRINSDWDCHSW